MSNKAVLAESFRVIWGAGDLDALPRFWTEDCVNHAMPSADNRFRDGRIAEHWSVADMAGLTRQLQA